MMTCPTCRGTGKDQSLAGMSPKEWFGVPDQLQVAGPCPDCTSLAMLRTFAGMQIVEAHQHPTGIVLELCPLGHMSRRWLYLEGVIAVSDVSDPPAATYRNRRGITVDDVAHAARTKGKAAAYDLIVQGQIDIGDDMYERQRYDEGDTDKVDDPAEHTRRGEL